MPSDGDSLSGYATMGRERWIGLHWPERLGGAGRDPLATVAAEERFGYHWLPLSGYLLSVKTIGNALLGHASDELQELLLPEIAAGRLVFCQGFSEPEAGSDLASLRDLGAPRRRALRGLGPQDLDLERPDRGLDLPRGANGPGCGSPAPRRSPCWWRTCARPGIEVREIPTVGGGVLCEVFLTEVEVPASQLVGELHGGWRVLMGTLDHERVTSEKVGVVLRVLDDLGDAAGSAAERLELQPSARRGPGRAAARAPGRGAARGRPPGRRGVVDGQALDRAARAAHRRAGRAPARAGGARGARSTAPARRAGWPLSPGQRRRHGGRRRGGDPAPGDRPSGPRVRGVSAVLETGSAAEARQFADTVAAVVARHAAPDAWHPGAAVSDAVPAARRGAAEAGWDELGADERLLPFAAPAAAALGRGLRLAGAGRPAARRCAPEPAALARYARGGGAPRGAARRAARAAPAPSG